MVSHFQFGSDQIPPQCQLFLAPDVHKYIQRYESQTQLLKSTNAPHVEGHIVEHHLCKEKTEAEFVQSRENDVGRRTIFRCAESRRFTPDPLIQNQSFTPSTMINSTLSLPLVPFFNCSQNA